MDLPKTYDPKKVEADTYARWEDSGYFNPDELPGERKEPFVISLPPPNVTGSLHMGHALNACIQDTLTRFARMQGKLALWVPGTDHAGIATQNVVEKELLKQGIRRHDLGREAFLEKVWEWKEQYGNIILEQLKKLGASADWSRTRFTMDDDYVRAVYAAFIRYYEKGLIYRDFRTVNWCVRCATALSDLELSYKDEKAKLYYMKYGPLTVATVRPETKLGDTALAVNPSDKRYKQYVGKELEIESVDGAIKVKVVADRVVDPKFGTGVVKVTPAHDATDFDIAKRHDLPMRQVIGHDGRMNENAGKYQGMKVLEAREEILKDLRAKDLIVKVEDYEHRVATCDRCGSVIEPLPSKQWFLKMDHLAKTAIAAVKKKKVKFHPKRWEKGYLDWLENIRDWNISRQIWWGHRLPVWYCACDEDERTFTASVEEPRLKCPRCKAGWQQVDDVLDTWFSSALWPFATLGWPDALEHDGSTKKGSDLARFYPTQVLSTARDIINLWVARMVFSGFEFLKTEPFSDVIIHATIMTKEGKRMSKSKGTGADPLEFIEKYGADATRFGILYQYLGAQDMKFGEEPLQAGKKFANKIWNASRFVLMQLEKNKLFEPDFPAPKHRSELDKKMLKELDALIKEVTHDLSRYEFGKPLHALYEFFWHHFADIYIEDAKERPSEHTQQMLVMLLATQLKLLHPFMPFITEAIYATLPLADKRLLLVEPWPKFS